MVAGVANRVAAVRLDIPVTAEFLLIKPMETQAVAEPVVLAVAHPPLRGVAAAAVELVFTAREVMAPVGLLVALLVVVVVQAVQAAEQADLQQ